MVIYIISQGILKSLNQKKQNKFTSSSFSLKTPLSFNDINWMKALIILNKFSVSDLI